VHFISGSHVGETAVLLPRAVQHAVKLKTLMGHSKGLVDEIPEVGIACIIVHYQLIYYVWTWGAHTNPHTLHQQSMGHDEDYDAVVLENDEFISDHHCTIEVTYKPATKAEVKKGGSDKLLVKIRDEGSTKVNGKKIAAKKWVSVTATQDEEYALISIGQSTMVMPLFNN
jgi:hypothetical protein